MNWQVFTHLSSIQVQIHWAGTILAFTLGVILLAGKKGTKFHVIFGRMWVTIMILVSVTAVFIRTPPDDSTLPLLFGFSPIHLLVPFTLALLFFGVRNARAKNIERHKRIMIFTFIGSLVVAGIFTFLPGRHMHTMFFGDATLIRLSIEEGLKR